MSSVLRSHALLIRAHVDAELHIYEGMWHGFIIYSELPESMAAHSVIVHFFDRHLAQVREIDGQSNSAGDLRQ